MGVPPVIIHFTKTFHEINHPFLGTRIYGNPFFFDFPLSLVDIHHHESEGCFNFDVQLPCCSHGIHVIPSGKHTKAMDNHHL